MRLQDLGERIAVGRTAEVFALGHDRVVKLDRPDWNGLAPFEHDILLGLAGSGLPLPASFGVLEVDGRTGMVLERLRGQSLSAELASAGSEARPSLWARLGELQRAMHRVTVDGLGDLVLRLGDEVERARLPHGLSDELAGLLASLDDGRRTVCHFDLHPGNVMVEGDRWVVIDWINVAAGPPLADVARTVLLGFAEKAALSGTRPDGLAAYVRAVCDRTPADPELTSWIRVVAGARAAEGFDGAQAGFLGEVAAASRRPI